MRSKKCIPAAEKMLESSEPEERAYALAALEKLTGEASTDTSAANEESSDRIVLRNGDELTGKVTDATCSIKTSYATLTFTTSEIGSIQVEGQSASTDVLGLRVGDRMSGAIQNETFTIHLTAGTDAQIKKSDIRTIRFGR